MTMSNTVQLDGDALYRAWRNYLTEHSVAKYFGAFDERTQSKFPFASLTIVGTPTNVTDLQNYEYTVDLTVQTDCYIDSDKISTLYGMDDANREFFNSLGFRKIGDSIPSQVNGSNVKRITSRYSMRNFSGKFLIDLDTE